MSWGGVVEALRFYAGVAEKLVVAAGVPAEAVVAEVERNAYADCQCGRSRSESQRYQRKNL